VNVRGEDELSTLARSINEMLQDLERSQNQFLFLADNIHQIFWIRDARTSSDVYLSPGLERVWGRSRDLLVADHLSWRDWLRPDDRAAVDQLQAEQAKGNRAELQYRIRAEDGEVRWLW
jgi:PAS domain-containing protein